MARRTSEVSELDEGIPAPSTDAPAYFDISSLDTLTERQEEGVWMDVLHPVTLVPIGMRVKVAGYESERAKRMQRIIANERLKQNRRQTTVEQAETDNRRVAVALVVDWDRFVHEGKELDCNKQNVETMFVRYPWLQRQVEGKAGDLAAFLET